MVLKPLVQNLITVLLGGLFLSLAFLTFGKPLLFDRIFFISLFIIAFAFRKDINLFGVTCIILTERLLEEIAYLFIPESGLLKFATYAACFYALYLRRNDNIFYLVSVSVIILIGAEIYWILIDYKFISTHWFIFLVTLNLMVRKAISSRIFWTAEMFPNKVAQPLKVDYYVYQLAAAFIIINLVTLGEYLLRHVLAVNSIFIYSNYGHINHILAFIFLFFFADQAIKEAQSRTIKL